MFEEQPSTNEQPQTTLEGPSKPNWRVWMAAGGCAVLLCAAVFVGLLVVAGPKFVQQFFPNQVEVAGELPRETTQINTMGDPNAPVHIIEYGDFQCPIV